MRKKTSTRATGEKRVRRPQLKKAVPPPDDPLSRHRSADDRVDAGDDDARQQALARAKALRQAKELPEPVDPKQTPPGDDC